MLICSGLDPLLVARYVSIHLWVIDQGADVYHVVNVPVQVSDFICDGWHMRIQVP